MTSQWVYTWLRREADVRCFASLSETLSLFCSSYQRLKPFILQLKHVIFRSSLLILLKKLLKFIAYKLYCILNILKSPICLLILYNI